ncbi:MAG: nucleotidyltransferase family protein [Chitinophagales bacterium]|nr:nucleotidyltransferase family protein [Chitinophagales bacterium]MDW8419854.1 nucleotidyltransferase family protein [Chitinophagales bacterium]
MKLPSAIVLAGGLGKRLRSVVHDLPKPMAPVRGKPFLHYVLLYAQRQGVREVILAVGYKSDAIAQYFGEMYLGVRIRYSIEQEPLGTGGALQQAMCLAGDEAIVLNGDTYFDVPLTALAEHHYRSGADITIAVKTLRNFDRYGTVNTNSQQYITSFEEKKPMEYGMINGGVYYVQKNLFAHAPASQSYSFERDILEKHVSRLRMSAYVCDGFFIDIGVPEDYAKAQEILPE